MERGEPGQETRLLGGFKLNGGTKEDKIGPSIESGLSLVYNRSRRSLNPFRDRVRVGRDYLMCFWSTVRSIVGR